MKIVFLLPASGERPVGGFKIVYQYADGLAARGHDVTVVHSAFMAAAAGFKTRLRRHGFNYLKDAIRGTWKPASWFQFNNHVNLTWIPVFDPIFLPKADAYVATWWLTAERLASWRFLRGARLYLIQGLETWGGPEERVIATWRTSLSKIVIARWLEDVLREYGQKSAYIPNGLDFNQFGCDRTILERNPFKVAMLFHAAEGKGCADGIAAIKIAKMRVPEITADLFGLPSPPSGLEPWIRYYQNPAQSELRSLYNRASVFISPSWTEGWGLPPTEAMMSGAAVVATDIGGHREYCIHGETALLAPVRSPAKLADQIIKLVTNSELRQQIAERGNSFIKQFTWNRAIDSFERVVAEEIEFQDRPSNSIIGDPLI